MSGEGAQGGPLQQYLSKLWTTGTHVTHTLIHTNSLTMKGKL